MKMIAVAGTGNVAAYLVEELVQSGFTVVSLTRSKKDRLLGNQVISRITDYSVEDLVKKLEDCDGVVSTVVDYTDSAVHTKVHLALLDACKKSVKCKHFIPNAWCGNIVDFPDQPIGNGEKPNLVLEALREQCDVQWTMVLIAWFMDYVVPKKNRHLRDIGGLFPVDYLNHTATIWGHGQNIVSMTAARDVGKSVAALFDYEQWEEFTYLEGDRHTWSEICELVTQSSASPSAWTIKKTSLAQSIKELMTADSAIAKYQAAFEIAGSSGSLELPLSNVKAQRAKYFSKIQYQTVGGMLDKVCKSSDIIV